MGGSSSDRERWLLEEAERERWVLATIEQGLPNDPWGATLSALSEGVADVVPGILYRLWRASMIPAEQLQDAVAWTWIHNRAPLACIGERRWLELFKSAGFIVAGVDQTRVGDEVIENTYAHLTERPAEPITVYRGAALRTRGRGLSWSLYRECARDNFAQPWADAYEQPSGLYRATVPPRAILALFGDHREQEVVVNPNMLRGRVELVERVEPDRRALAERERRFRAVIAGAAAP